MEALLQEEERQPMSSSSSPLPSELTLVVFGYLGVLELAKIKSVCKEWNQLATQAIDAKAENSVRPFQNRLELKRAVESYTNTPSQSKTMNKLPESMVGLLGSGMFLT
jgi:hypothetical protein